MLISAFMAASLAISRRSVSDVFHKVIIATARSVGVLILAESGLSLLGFGVQPPTSTRARCGRAHSNTTSCRRRAIWSSRRGDNRRNGAVFVRHRGQVEGCGGFAFVVEKRDSYSWAKTKRSLSRGGGVKAPSGLIALNAVIALPVCRTSWP